ncbi:MAG: hypothetical protein OXC44_01930 [Proteobacteria bacterium]|nr:hypothetical protein [Pseudomonadota bacterium]
MMFGTLNPFNSAIASLNHSHDFSTFKENTPAVSRQDEKRRSIRFYKEAPGSSSSSTHDSEDEDNEDLEAWLESTKASNNNSLDGPVDDSYIQKTLEKIIDNPAITPALIRSTVKPTGRISYEYTLAIHSLPIWKSHIKAIKMHNDAISIVGGIPTSIYDSDHFEKAIMNIHDQKNQALTDMLTTALADDDASFDPQKLSLVAKHSCVLSLDDHFVPGICAQFLYNYSYYEATFHHLGLASYVRIASHACANLKDIYTFNPNTQKQNFLVNVCSQRSTNNALANERVILGGNNNECKPARLYAAIAAYTLSSQRLSINSLLDSFKPYGFRGNPELETEQPENSSLLGNLQPSRLHFSNGVFSYYSSDTFAQRQAHVFSYVNRMYEWFVSLGFKSPDPSPIFLIIQSQETGDFAQPGQAFYTGIYPEDLAKKNPGGQTLSEPLHMIVYGNDNKDMQNIAYDFDISAHELGHYIITHNIRGVFIESKGKPEPKRYNDNYPDAYHTSAIHEGLADYFTFAATGDTCLGESAIKPDHQDYGMVSRPKGECLRTHHPTFTYQGPETGTYEDRNGNPLNLYNFLVLQNGFHYLGQLLSGTLWEARKQTSRDDKRLFDKVILNSLDYADKYIVSFVDIIAAILKSDAEIANKKFCKNILSGAEKYKLLNVTEQTTKDRITKMKQVCESSSPVTPGSYTYKVTEENVDATSASAPQPFSVAGTVTTTCSSQSDLSQLLATGVDVPLPQDTNTESLRKPIGNGCSGTLRLKSVAHAQSLEPTTTEHNQLSWWWLWMCLPLWVMMIRKKHLTLTTHYSYN